MHAGKEPTSRKGARSLSEADILPAGGTTLPGFGSGSPAPKVGSNGQFGSRYATEYAPLFSHSAKMRAVRQIVEEVASTDATVLVRGETGAGKDVVARAIHAASSRRDRAFVKVNCAALPAELLESELFGHEKGAFTGAYRRKLGKFEFANKGTIFLDEIGELSRSLQAKLLHVLQDLEFSRIGGREVIRVDTRVIASTNRDVEAAMSRGEFRDDLYYRLNVVEIRVPPLRDRKEEIPALAAWFLARFNAHYGRSVELSAETIALFGSYFWPGNVRELENLVRRLVVLGNARQLHEELHARLPAAPMRSQLLNSAPGGKAPAWDGEPSSGLKDIARRAAREAERRALAEVLDRVHWNRTEAARLLKVSYKTLLNKIAECGLGPGQGQGKP